MVIVPSTLANLLLLVCLASPFLYMQDSMFRNTDLIHGIEDSTTSPMEDAHMSASISMNRRICFPSRSSSRQMKLIASIVGIKFVIEQVRFVVYYLV